MVSALAFVIGWMCDATQLGRGFRLLLAVDGRRSCDDQDPIEPNLMQNALGQWALQFDHGTPPTGRLGHDAVFVLPRPKGLEEMVEKATTHFAKVELAERGQVECMGVDPVEADINFSRGYQGAEDRR